MRILKAALPLMLCAGMFAQKPTMPGPGPTHNGMWWESKSSLYKEAFIGGYKSGVHHAAGHLLDVNKFATSEEIAGLDKFYHDFRNRSIVIDDALNYVAEQMRGVSEEQLKTELEHMRAAAAPPATADE